MSQSVLCLSAAKAAENNSESWELLCLSAPGRAGTEEIPSLAQIKDELG